MSKILRNNGLTLVLMAVFLLTWIGQCLTGLREHNENQREHGQSQLSLPQYLVSGHFWEATAENWESEFLQMSMFVVLTCFLFQKGSPESNDPDEQNDPVDETPHKSKKPNSPWPVHRGGIVLKLYSYSLSICFLIMFIISFALHARHGATVYNEDQREHRGQVTTTMGYLGTSRFWFEAFQNWQSEFLSLAAMVYLSVYLRQKGSAESKPVAAPHDENE